MADSQKELAYAENELKKAEAALQKVKEIAGADTTKHLVNLLPHLDALRKQVEHMRSVHEKLADGSATKSAYGPLCGTFVSLLNKLEKFDEDRRKKDAHVKSIVSTTAKGHSDREKNLAAAALPKRRWVCCQPRRRRREKLMLLLLLRLPKTLPIKTLVILMVKTCQVLQNLTTMMV